MIDEPERMLRDVHPAEVLLPDGTFIRKARAFITTHRLIVWVEGRGRIPEKRLEFEVSERSVEAQRGTTGAGERLEIYGLTQSAIINKGTGCNCGSSLKALSAPVSW